MLLGDLGGLEIILLCCNYYFRVGTSRRESIRRNVTIDVFTKIGSISLLISRET